VASTASDVRNTTAYSAMKMPALRICDLSGVWRRVGLRRVPHAARDDGAVAWDGRLLHVALQRGLAAEGLQQTRQLSEGRELAMAAKVSMMRLSHSSWISVNGKSKPRNGLQR
jgi:hypothetical protein